MGLSAEQLANLSNLYNLPLQVQPVPLQDLGAQGAYSTPLAIPGDIAPLLAITSGQGYNDPRLVDVVDPERPGYGSPLRAMAVYDVAGQGGTPVGHSFADTADFTEAAPYAFSLGMVPAKLFSHMFSIMWESYNGPDVPSSVNVWLQGDNSAKVLDLGRLAIDYNASPTTAIPISYTRDWPAGLSLAGFFPGDTDVTMNVLPNTIGPGTLAWTLLTD